MDGVKISTENVRPSSPTPQHLRTHKLSFLDRFAPPILFPIVLYFPNTIETIADPDLFISQTTHNLKRSLSLTLTRFYPLAGRVNIDGQSIDCNDEGVPFVVVKFTGQKLSDLLKNPEPNLPSSLLPCEAKSDTNHGPDSTLALVQVSYFESGGIAIGAVFSHLTADAGTVASFLKSWSATASGSGQPVCPNYIAQSMFPQREETQVKPTGSKEEQKRRFTSSIYMMTGKPVVRRYRFDAGAISSLKAKSGMERPSRVEVVSALLWKCYMAASLANNYSVSLVSQFVNLRRRARPALSPDCVGNLVLSALATSCNEKDVGIGELVRKLRDAVRMIDDDLVNRMRGDEGISAFIKILFQQKKVPEGVRVDLLNTMSWCSFGLYSSDFGWGKPVWITRCDTGNDLGSEFINSFFLMDTKNGDGVEAWLIFDEKYVSVFDNDEDIRALASIDPSPLDN